MSGYVPEQSRAYPANHLCFEIPTSLYKAVLAATHQAELAGTPTDWLQLHTTGPSGRVVEFSGTFVLPELAGLDPLLQDSPFIRYHPSQVQVSHPTLVGNFRTRLSEAAWQHDNDMVVSAHTIRSRRTLGGLLGRKAIFLTAWQAPFAEPHKDRFNTRRPEL